MFENRSFDNLLGRLYQPGEVASFEGVAGLDLSNPVPEWAAGADPGTVPRLVPYGTTIDMNSPSPDPGEEYPHVNTQLFGLIDPPSNRGMVIQHIVAPYNAPPSPGQRPTMDGFVTDYISAFTAEMGRAAGLRGVRADHDRLRTAAGAGHLGAGPRLRDLRPLVLRGAVADVPQPVVLATRAPRRGSWSTWNPTESFPLHNDAETIFERLEARGLTWRVYCDPPSHIALTGNHPRAPAAASGGRRTSSPRTGSWRTRPPGSCRPTRSSSPTCCTATTICTRPSTRCSRGWTWTRRPRCWAARRCWPRSTTRSGSSASPSGSNAYNTLFLVTFDEHGGTYDHVPPPAVLAPDPAAPAGQMGFRFDRSGCEYRPSPSRRGSRRRP